MTTPNFSGGTETAQFYGAGPHRFLNQVLLGGGSTNNMTLPAPTTTAGSVAPCAAEIVSAVYNAATGTYLLTFAGNHWAVAKWDVAIDDVNGSTPVQGYLGQFTGLGTNAPLTCVLTTYAAGSAANVALNTPVRISIWFKDDTTGAAA